jgi:hypothetical protein
MNDLYDSQPIFLAAIYQHIEKVDLIYKVVEKVDEKVKIATSWDDTLKEIITLMSSGNVEFKDSTGNSHPVTKLQLDEHLNVPRSALKMYFSI